MASAQVKGRDPKSKNYYDVKVSEAKTLRPSRLLKLMKELEDDYDYIAFEITSIRGTAAKSGDAYVFTARGSKQEYALKATDALKKLVDEGKTSVVLGGKLKESKVGDKDVLTLEVTTAAEAK